MLLLVTSTLTLLRIGIIIKVSTRSPGATLKIQKPYLTVLLASHELLAFCNLGISAGAEEANKVKLEEEEREGASGGQLKRYSRIQVLIQKK